MPLQNRVDPWGQLHAVAAKGALMGNRGKLHDESRTLHSRWEHQRWVACLLDFKARKREIWGPQTYSELFFLDEATAFAAGHRPCAECQRTRYNLFKSAWLAANPEAGLRAGDSIDRIDAFIHRERTQGPNKRTFNSRLPALPGGTLVAIGNEAYLTSSGGLRRWSFDGYGPLTSKATEMEVEVLTPQSIVRTFAAGFKPDIHAGANSERVGQSV
jgi:hypothetical protein